MAGAFSSFRKLMDNMGELSTVASRVATAVSDDINGFLAKEFVDEADPYDTPWPELADSTIRKKGHDRIMWETGETEAQTRAYPMRGAGIEVTSTQKAGYNQFEGENRPARPVLPSREDLPLTWQNAIKERFAEAVARKGKAKK